MQADDLNLQIPCRYNEQKNTCGCNQAVDKKEDQRGSIETSILEIILLPLIVTSVAGAVKKLLHRISIQLFELPGHIL